MFLKTPQQYKAFPLQLSLKRDGQWDLSVLQGGSGKLLIRGAKGKVVVLRPAGPYPSRWKVTLYTLGLSESGFSLSSAAECRDASSCNRFLTCASSCLLRYFMASALSFPQLTGRCAAPGSHLNRTIQKRAVSPVWSPAATPNQTCFQEVLSVTFGRKTTQARWRTEQVVLWNMGCGGAEADGAPFSLKVMQSLHTPTTAQRIFFTEMVSSGGKQRRSGCTI